MFRTLITIKTLSSGFLNKLKGWIRFPEVCEPLFVHLGQVWSPNGPIYVCRWVLLWVEEICLNFLFSSPTQGVCMTVNCSHEPQHTSTLGLLLLDCWSKLASKDWTPEEVFHVSLTLISHSLLLIIYDKLEPFEVSNVMATVYFWNDTILMHFTTKTSMKYLIFKRNILGNKPKVERGEMRGRGHHGINVWRI